MTAFFRKLWLKLARQNRASSATAHFKWFRAGYITALEDIERTGLRPMTPKTRREFADSALEKWVETGEL